MLFVEVKHDGITEIIGRNIHLVNFDTATKTFRYNYGEYEDKRDNVTFLKVGDKVLYEENKTKGDDDMLSAKEMREKQQKLRDDMATKELSKIKKLLEDALDNDDTYISIDCINDSTKNFLTSKGYTIEHKRTGMMDYEYIISW